MDSINEKLELEDGEIDELEDGEIEEDETTEITVKTTSHVTPSPDVYSDFSRHSSTLREDKSPHFNPKIPQDSQRRDSVSSPRYNVGENRSNRPYYERSPSVHAPEFLKSPRPSFSRNNRRSIPTGTNRGKQRAGLLPSPPRLPLPVMRLKPYFSQTHPRSPSPAKSPDIDKADDFDLLLKRHKQIQLQLENLEREESDALFENEDIIDDSFIDIPVDNGGNRPIYEPGSSGILSNDFNLEKPLPDKFSPFKIKPLRPPIPSLKELSEKQKQDTKSLGTLRKVSINLSKTSNAPAKESLGSAANPTAAKTNSQKKRQARQRRKRRRLQKKKQNKVNEAMLTKTKVHQPELQNSKKMEPTTEIDSKLMEIASSSTNNEMNLKIRNTTEQQKKRRERIKQWQKAHWKKEKKTINMGGKIPRSPSAKSGSDGKEFEKDDYLEAPMDVESDTPDGPVLPLIEEAGNDPPPPPPLPISSSREHELMALLQKQQQMTYGIYPVQAIANSTNVSPNIHGFYPPGQIIFNEWQSSYPIESGETSYLQTEATDKNKSADKPIKSIASSEEDDDEADLLREILLKSVAKKRAAKTNGNKISDSTPSSPKLQQLSTLTYPPQNISMISDSVKDLRPKQQNQKAMVSLQPPQHEPVVIQLGHDSDDSDESDNEQQVLQQRGGFFGSLDRMIKQARQSAVENSKPKQLSAEPINVPKTPDALLHLPEERRAEYKRLKEQLALHEGKKRRPLSDISQDKETKEENEDKQDGQGESNDVTELKEKVKLHEEKFAKTRNLLSEDHQRLAKMTSLLSDRTALLGEQEEKVARIKKQLEAHQKAMLNNKVMIKKLHDKATTVKDRIAKRVALSRNIEEELLRMKSMVSAVRKNPGFYASNEKEETSKTKNVETTKPSEVKRLASLKRSKDDIHVMNSKKAKVDSPNRRKQAYADIIAQEKARLKALERELVKKLSNYSKITVNKKPAKDSPVNAQTESSTLNENEKNSSKSAETSMYIGKEDSDCLAEVESTSKQASLLDMMDTKQLDYIKSLQEEKCNKELEFPSLATEFPLPIHKKVAKCIWLKSKSTPEPEVNIKASMIDWFATSDTTQGRVKDMNSSITPTIGLYESVLLYFKSYRLSPYFRTKSGLSLKSLSHSNKINPYIPLCKYELQGTCNDEQCQYQHKKDYTPTPEDTLRDLAAYIISDHDQNLVGKAAEDKIQDIIQHFVNQYKDKIPMDDLYLLLVNHVRVNANMSQPYYICGVNHSLLAGQTKKNIDEKVEERVSERASVDKGRGVLFPRKKETKGLSKNSSRECQEVRYFSEVYNGLTTLLNAVRENPSDVPLWIKLARLQMCQKPDDEEEDDEAKAEERTLQSLNTLSRGLEENPTSEELWHEYLTLFRAQANSQEHKELCEQAISYTPSFSIWWHYLESTNTYHDKRTLTVRLIIHLATQDESADIHSHRLLEFVLFLVQLDLYTGRLKTALSTFALAVGRKKTGVNGNEFPNLTSKLSSGDLILLWLGYIHMFEFHRLPSAWFDQKNGQPSRMVAKDPIVFPWEPDGGTRALSEKLLGLFHLALSSCTHRDKSMSKVFLCLPLYQNLLALERAHGRVDSAKGICRRLLQGNPTITELWLCLAALEESTGYPGKALIALKDGLDNCDHDNELAYSIARIYIEQKQPSSAIKILITNTKTKYLKATSNNSNIDPIKLYRKLLNQTLPYDAQPLDLIDGWKLSGKDILYLWLGYCLLLELAPNMSPLCLQYNLSADSAYSTAVHSIIITKHAQTVWLEYLFYKKFQLSQHEIGQDDIIPMNDLIGQCLASVSTSTSLPFSTAESWQDYSFHNQVINLYLGFLPQSLWSVVFKKYLKAYPSNVQLAIRACEHEVKSGTIDKAVKIAAMFLAENPKCLTMWKIIISLNLQRSHNKEAHKLYQQSTDMLPFAVTLWKDFIMFEMVHGDKTSVSAIIQSCDKVGIDIQDYLNTLLGK